METVPSRLSLFYLKGDDSMAMPDDKYGVIMQKRSGKTDDPFISINETISVNNQGLVVLEEVPDKFNHVTIPNMYEIYDGIPDTDEFLVNYNNGNITFNVANNGNQYVASYKGTGKIYVSAKRIATQIGDTGDIIQDLQQLTDDANAVIQNGIDAKNLVQQFIYKGAYSPSVSYVPYNIVSFDGGTYRCILNTTGHDPTNSTYWVIEAQAGNIKPFSQSWTATDGQTVFTTTNPYNPNNNTLNLYVGGLYQPYTSFTQTNAYTITLSESVSSGTLVTATWFMNNIDSTADITTVSGFGANVSDKIGDLSKLTTTDKTSLVNAVNSNVAQLADIATQQTTNVNNIAANTTAIANIGNGSPKGTYATLSALQTAYPSGTTGVYIVTADGGWYYWSVSSWAKGGTYQATAIAKQSVGYDKTDFLTTGKNMFDKSKRTLHMVVSDVDGTLSSDLGTNYDTSDYIPVSSGVTYFINKVRKYALYNTSKTYVSGYNNTAYGSATFTPSQDGYIRFYVGQSFVDTTQMEIGSVGTSYESYKLTMPSTFVYDGNNLLSKSLDKTKIKDNTFTESQIDPTSNIVVKKTGKNLIDMSKITTGNYVDYSSGRLVVNADNNVSDYIALLPNTTYTLSSQVSGDLSQLAFYDTNKTYVSGLPNSGTQQSITFTTGATVYYVRVTIPATVTSGMQLELGSVMTSYEPYQIAISKSDLPSVLFSSSNIITVKQDGTGNFTSLRAAVDSIKDASAAKPYTIQIYEGTYDILSYYTQAEITATSFIGLIKPDYVDFVGIGDKKKIILQWLFPSDATFDVITKGRVSAICWYGNGTMENLTVTGQNLRYCVHDDYNFPNANKVIKKCRFIRYKGDGTNYGGEQAWGEGSWSGMNYLFEDCEFRTEWNYFAYTSHNNTGFTDPTYHKFVNCKFFTTMGESVRFESLGSGQKDVVEMINCRFNGNIALTPYGGNTAGNIDYELKGHGNEFVPVRFANTDGVNYTYEFGGETREMYNGGATNITKGMPVMLNSDNSSIVPFTGNGKIRFFGIASQDIPTGSSGIVRVAGFLPISKTNLTGLTISDMIGITNGALVKVTSGDYIGYVALTDYIRLV